MYKTIKILLFTACFFLSSPAFSASFSLDGTVTTESGTDCDLATYRFGFNESWNGTALDLLVEVVATDNEYVGDFCVGIRDGVFSVNIRDKDAGDNIAFVDTVMTIVARNTTTPVNVDRMTATGFDLDISPNPPGQYASGTDDIYFSSIGAGFVSGNTEVTYNSGMFVGGHDNQLAGSTFGNCDDAPNNLEVQCRAAATWTGGASNSVSQINVRFQNDNAYGDVPTDDDLRRCRSSVGLDVYDTWLWFGTGSGLCPATQCGSDR